MPLLIPPSNTISTLLNDVQACGFGLLPRCGEENLASVLSALGEVIHTEDVVVREESRALVTSRRALPPHTDHHRASWILWLCVAQTEKGGESLAVDARQVYMELSPTHREALRRVVLHEHSIFAGDMERHPMVWGHEQNPRFYYSYWLADDEMAGVEREAFDAFTEGVQRAPQHCALLAPGDLLVVNNHRILHGRTAIEGSPCRHLRRFWVEASELP